MRYFLAQVLLFSLLPTLSAQPPRPNEPLVDQVKTSIDRGIDYMRGRQRADGGWEVDLEAQGYLGGRTSLAVTALLNAGLTNKDPVVVRGLEYLRNLKNPDKTYVRALQTIAFAEANLPEDRPRILDNVKWLLDARVFDENKRFLGWSYTQVPSGGFRSTDNSNIQYAVLALWAARQADIDIKQDVWLGIRDLYLTTQNDNGGYRYAPFTKLEFVDLPRLTMTIAGLSGLLISGMELNEGREQFLPSGVARNCGEYTENDKIQKSLNLIIKSFVIQNGQQTFYHLYGLERAGRLTGQRFFGEHDWYREGCDFLVRQQKLDGSWYLDSTYDQWPVVSTSFALLFLSKGRTPILMSKVVHGAWPRQDKDHDWNNDRNDLRNLVSFSSKQLFQRQPLAWQSFDIMRAATPRGDEANPTEESLDETTSEMLQSPILYITGHQSPLQRFTSAEKILLKRYVDNGGFIFAEACCGSAAFDKGFKALVRQLWPDGNFDPLDIDHPVWTSFHKVVPNPRLKLHGLTGNCKTILIYSETDLSCRWESNRLKDPAVLEAFQIGNNIIAYATGLEPPRPRLTKVKVGSQKSDPPTIPRGYYKAAQLRINGLDRPAPKAMRKLMEHVHADSGLDVALKTDLPYATDPYIVDYKFLYVHGRDGFQIDDEGLDKLRFNLQNGGLLFADACCGRESFDKSFREFVQKQLFPGKKFEQVPADDLLFSQKLNGVALTRETIKCRQTIGGGMQPAQPLVEGIKHEDRWVVLYSKYDIGCALEGHKSSDCRGYDQKSAQLLGRAAVLYTLWP